MVKRPHITSSLPKPYFQSGVVMQLTGGGWSGKTAVVTKMSTKASVADVKASSSKELEKKRLAATKFAKASLADAKESASKKLEKQKAVVKKEADSLKAKATKTDKSEEQGSEKEECGCGQAPESSSSHNEVDGRENEARWRNQRHAIKSRLPRKRRENFFMPQIDRTNQR